MEESRGKCLRLDYNNWMPVSPAEIYEMFSLIPITWCIAGGWALDLHLGRQTREHRDIDVVVFRDEQTILYEAFEDEWMLYKAEKEKLFPWLKGEFLENIQDVWVSRDVNSPWLFQIMLVNREQGKWIYRREQSIREPVNNVFYYSQDGIPYMNPVFQLLYKAGSSQIREKDFIDFQNVLPYLRVKEKEWLKKSLNIQFPLGHKWVKYL